MRVIITGGTGFIGSRLAAQLANDGHEVIVLSRSPEKHTFAGAIRGETWDAKTAEGWGHLAEGADAIVNLAGESIAGTGLIPDRWTPEKKRRIRESRLNAGAAVMEAINAAAEKPKLLVQASAVGYYGYGGRGDEVLTANSAPGNDFMAQVCVDWEASTAAAEAVGVRRVILRTGLVLSMEDGAFPITVLPFRLFIGGPLGNGEQWWPWIHIDDEISAIRFLMENEGASGPFNLAAPNPLKNKEFAKAIGEVLRRPSFIPAPSFALRLALGETADIVLEGQRAVPEKLQQLGYRFQYTEARAALRDLLR